MMRALASLVVILVLGAAVVPAAPAHASRDTLRIAADDARVSLSEAIGIVKRRFGDVEILKAETKRRGERAEHRIRILTADGRVRDVRVDARTGGIR